MTLTQVIEPPDYAIPSLVNDLTQLYQLAKMEKNRYASNWRRNYLIVNNRHYATETSVIGSPNVTDSEVFPILDSRIAWMTDQKVMVDVMPARSHHRRSASTCNGSLPTWSNALTQPSKFSRGISRSSWLCGTHPYSEPGSSAPNGILVLITGLGNVNIRRVDPWTFYPDPNATSLKDAEYLFEVRRMSYAEIERRFPSSSEQMILDAIQFGEASDNFQRPGTDNNPQIPMAWPAVLPGASGNQGAGSWGLEGQTNLHSGSVLQQGVNVYVCMDPREP